MDPLKQLRERLDAIDTERRALHEAAGDNPLDETQQTRWDALDTDETEVREEIRKAEIAERTRESRKRFGATLMPRVTPFDGADVRDLPRGEVRDRALAVLDSRDHADHLSDAQKATLARSLRASSGNTDGSQIARRLLLTETDEYRSAFVKAMLHPTPVFTAEEGRAVQAVQEFRAMSEGTDSAGGFGVPVLIDPTIILTAQGHPLDIVRVSRVETITNDEWKGVTSAGVTWAFRAEAAATTDGSPTLAQPTVKAHRADAYIPYSIEVGQDYPGFAAEMSRLLASGYDELLAQKLTVGAGNGSNEPFGIVTALDANTNVELSTTTAGAIGAVDINRVWDALPIRYRRTGARTAWMSSTDVEGDIQQLGAGNDSAFTVNFTAEGVTRLKGRDYYNNDYMADMPAGTTAGNVLIVGDWQNYLIAQRAGMNVELVQHVFDVTNSRPTGQRAWFAWARVGADSINDLAFRLLQNKTS